MWEWPYADWTEVILQLGHGRFLMAAQLATQGHTAFLSCSWAHGVRQVAALEPRDEHMALDVSRPKLGWLLAGFARRAGCPIRRIELFTTS